MKKIFTILGALALTIAMNAQQLAKMQKPELVKVNTPSAVYTAELDAEGYAVNAVPFKAPAANKDTVLEGQYFIDGQMYMSATPGYVTGNCFLITPYKDTTVYYSVMGKGKWVYEALNEDETAYKTITVEDTAVLYYPSASYGWDYCNPTLSVYPNEVKFTQDGGKTWVTYNATYTDYMYGYAAEAYWPGEIAPTNMMNGYWQPEQMTNCEMMNADRSGDQDNAGNRYMVSSGQAGTPWCFGTGMEMDVWGKGTMDTLVNIIPIPEGKSMWCDSVFVHCYNRDAASIEELFPATTNLTLTIYPIRIEVDPVTGKKTLWFRHDSIMAQATATQKNCKEDGGGYTIQFVFKEKNPFGTMDVKPATFGQYCYAELTGFNESGCNFGIFCDYWETPTGGRTMWLKDNKFHSYGDMNIDMAFNAYYTDIHMWDDCWINEVGAEGGVLTMGFIGTDGEEYSTDTIEFACNISTDFLDDADLYDANGEIIDTKKSDLIADYEIISGPHTYEEGGEEYISLTAAITIEVKANPTENARQEVVYLQAYGAKQPIVIKQAAGTVGLHKVKAINDNKYYNIFGTEVNKNFKGVVIRNGQTLLQ